MLIFKEKYTCILKVTLRILEENRRNKIQIGINEDWPNWFNYRTRTNRKKLLERLMALPGIVLYPRLARF